MLVGIYIQLMCKYFSAASFTDWFIQVNTRFYECWFFCLDWGNFKILNTTGYNIWLFIYPLACLFTWLHCILQYTLIFVLYLPQLPGCSNSGTHQRVLLDTSFWSDMCIANFFYHCIAWLLVLTRIFWLVEVRSLNIFIYFSHIISIFVSYWKVSSTSNSWRYFPSFS